MKHLLLVYHSQTGNTEQLAQAAAEGIADEPEVSLRQRRALEADLDDIAWADAVLLGTPENFGTMSGALKDFFDRTYYPAREAGYQRPYALFISCENDGSGAVREIERIITGLTWRAVAEPLICRGQVTARCRAQSQELGATVAAGLAFGIF